MFFFFLKVALSHAISVIKILCKQKTVHNLLKKTLDLSSVGLDNVSMELYMCGLDERM